MKIALVGDISMGEHYFSFGHGPRTLAEGKNLFESVQPTLRAADLVIGNLEGPLSDIGYDPSEPESRVFRGSPEAVQQLASAGFKVLQVANNHIAQHGAECFNDTVERLQSAGIQPIGLRNQEPYIYRNGGVSLAILAASAVLDNTDPDQQSYEPFDLEKIRASIRAVKDSVDWVMVCLHWGREERIAPTDQQREWASQLKQAGANFIVGHHPHIFYEIERDQASLIAWSLGNFVFDLPWDERLNKTGILQLNLDVDRFEAKVVEIGIEPNGTPTLAQKEESSVNSGVTCLYSHSESFTFSPVKKLSYFFSNFHQGHSKQKLKFISRKLAGKMAGLGARFR